MKRMRELIADIRIRYPADDFFSDFERSCKSLPLKRKHYRSYNEALMVLDNESWRNLKEKALRQYLNHREGQTKQGFFNQLNEALAFRNLVRKGFSSVRLLCEGENKRPDISFNDRNMQKFCEVKTLGISDCELLRRSGQLAFNGSVYVDLDGGILNKLEMGINEAWRQIWSLGENGLVFVIIQFDDISLDYYQKYRKQLVKFSQDRNFDNLVIKMGLRGNRKITIISGPKTESPS